MTRCFSSSLHRLRLALVSTCLLCASAVAPQPLAADEPSADPRYHALVEEAIQEYEGGNWNEALAAFEQAHALYPNARTLRGMGMAAFEAHRYVDAIQRLQDALLEQRHALTPEQRDEVMRVLERARRYVAHLKLGIEPSGVPLTIKVNGRVCRPDEHGLIDVDPGLLEVEVTAETYEPLLRHMDVNAGDSADLNGQLEPAHTEDGASSHAADWVEASAKPSAPAATPNSDDAIGVLKWVSGGVAIGSLVTGAVLLGLQKSKASDFDAHCQGYKQLPAHCASLRDDVRGPLWTGPIVAFSVAGALAALTAVLFVVDADQSDARASAYEPACDIGPGAIGLQCHAHF